MTQGLEERNNCEAGANNNIPEELSNETIAASILLDINSMELDRETAQNLEQMKGGFFDNLPLIYPDAPMAPIHLESSQAINGGPRTNCEREKSATLEGKKDVTLGQPIDEFKVLEFSLVDKEFSMNDGQSRMENKILGKLPINQNAQRASIRLKTSQSIYGSASTSQKQQKLPYFESKRNGALGQNSKMVGSCSKTSEIINGGIHGHKVEWYQPVRPSSLEDKKNWNLVLKEAHIGRTIDGIEIPEFPPVENLKGLMERCSVPFEKQLTITDVKEDQSRVSLPGDIVRKYLKPLLYPEEEKVFIVHGIEVTTYDLNGNEYPMTFKFWASKFNVLTSGWKKFCHDKELIAHEDWITVWMFRHRLTRKLCFVVLSRRFSISELFLIKIEKETEKEEKQSINTTKRLKIKHED